MAITTRVRPTVRFWHKADIDERQPPARPEPVSVQRHRESDGNYLDRIMQDDAERVSLPRTQATDAVTKIHPIDAALSIHGSAIHGENHSISPVQGYDLDTRLHAWPLFGEYKLAAGKIALGFR